MIDSYVGYFIPPSQDVAFNPNGFIVLKYKDDKLQYVQHIQ